MNELIKQLTERVLILENELSQRKLQQVSYPIDTISMKIVRDELKPVATTGTTTAPATASGTPTTRYGANTKYLGDPDAWALVTLPEDPTSVQYKLPLFI